MVNTLSFKFRQTLNFLIKHNVQLTMQVKENKWSEITKQSKTVVDSNFWKTCWARVMGQQVRAPSTLARGPPAHLNSLAHTKGSVATCPCYQCWGDSRFRGSLRLAGLQPGSRFSDRSLLKGIRWRPGHPMSSSGFHTGTRTHTHTHTIPFKSPNPFLIFTFSIKGQNLLDCGKLSRLLERQKVNISCCTVCHKYSCLPWYHKSQHGNWTDKQARLLFSKTIHRMS